MSVELRISEENDVRLLGVRLAWAGAQEPITGVELRIESEEGASE